MSDSAAEKDFVITRTFDAPRELVFRAWADPTQMARWWGPRICSCPVSEMNARAGGLYRITMRMPDGVDYPITGEFLTVKAPEKIVMTMDCTGHPAAWHDMVQSNRSAEDKNPAGIMVMTATFDEQNGRTELTVRIRFATPEIGEALTKMGMRDGWSQSLNRLDENLTYDALGKTDEGRREVFTFRVVNAPLELVWDAWTDPEKIAKWWGPDGFTNSIQTMNLKPGGAWNLTMHGPDGTDYKNEMVFVEVVKPSRIVLDHVSAPVFRMIVILDDTGDGRTRITMKQQFDTPEKRESFVRMPGVVTGAQQMLNRLAYSLSQAKADCFPHESQS